MDTITTDFDQTLALHTPQKTTSGGVITSFVMEPNYKLINYLRSLKEKGKKVYIVTFRKKSETDEIRKFLKDNDLRVNGIVATDGKPKVAAIYRLKSIQHFDDDVETLVQLSKLNKNIKPVLVPNEQNLKDPLADKFLHF
jgi:hydroxymethylpyrimidine pyrophosphatase-like HAD family hydrolase